MENMKATITITPEEFEKLYEVIKQRITEDIKDDIYEQLIDELEPKIVDTVIDNLNISDEIQSWFDDNVDIEHEVEKYVDYNVDVEDRIQSLLNSYEPSRSSCSTGNSFTNAVTSCVNYLINDTDFVRDFDKAIDKYKVSKILEDQKVQIIEHVKPEIIANFVYELEKYAKDLELLKAKELLMITDNQQLDQNINQQYGNAV